MCTFQYVILVFIYTTPIGSLVFYSEYVVFMKDGS
jgi:hypothetical protein